MTDLQTKYVEFKKRIRVFDNGQAAETMRNLGMNYKTIHGLALSQIRAIARIFAPDHELADFLWDKDIREAKLAAIYLYDAQKLSQTAIFSMLESIQHAEMAEQFSFSIIQNRNDALAIALKLIDSKNPIYQTISALVLSKLTVENWPTPAKQLPELIEKLSAQALQTDNLAHRNALARALKQIGHADGYKNQILALAIQLDQSPNKHARWIGQELLLLKEF